jgi:integrase
MRSPDAGPTFQEFAEEWTSGELHRLYPDHVARKESADDDIYRLKAHIYPIVGTVRIREFRAQHAELVMGSLPELAAGSRRHVAQLVSRVLKLAVYPARLIERSPVPSGFLPKLGPNRAQAWLYPSEEARLLDCADIPLLHRFFYGFLAREGLRSGDAAALEWRNVDLERGVISLDENKTDNPRAWTLDPSVRRALVRWKERFAEGAEPDALVFMLNGVTLDVEHLAASFRSHLQQAGGIRPILFERTPNRMRIRIHDQRATFVTLALASGRTETWVADRTGHKSSQMINRYRRSARTAAELNLGWLAPLDQAIPELSESVCQTSAGGASGSETAPTVRRKPAEPRASQRLATPQADLGSGDASRGGSSPSSCTHFVRDS